MDEDIKSVFDTFNSKNDELDEEYKWPPANDKFCNKPVLGQWVERYLSFRESIEGYAESSSRAKEYLDNIGQNSSELASKFRGAMLGMSIGDALGTTLEFKSRDSYQHIQDRLLGRICFLCIIA